MTCQVSDSISSICHQCLLYQCKTVFLIFNITMFNRLEFHARVFKKYIIINNSAWWAGRWQWWTRHVYSREETCLMRSRAPATTPRETPVACCTTWRQPSVTFTPFTSYTATSSQRTSWYVPCLQVFSRLAPYGASDWSIRLKTNEPGFKSCAALSNLVHFILLQFTQLYEWVPGYRQCRLFVYV